MTNEDLIRRQKMIDTIMDVQSDYYDKNPTKMSQYYPEIGGYVAPGAGSEMIDPIIWEEVLKEYSSPDQYAEQYLRNNK
jgi:hypothetical protein